MGLCPSCNYDIGDDFGLVVCTNCGRQVLAGEAQQNKSVTGVTEALNPPPYPAEVFEPPAEAALIEDLPAPSEEFSSKSEAATEQIPLEASSSKVEPVPETPTRKLPLEDLSDLATFANSEVSQAQEGPLLYRITFSDIDTAEVRRELHETLADARFFWDADRLVRSIRSGRLVLEDVSAAKAYLLIDRVKNLPITVEWEQYAIHQS